MVVTTYPRTVMVHPTHAAVTYATVMAHGRLKRLALAAHAMGRILPPLFLLGHGRARDGPRVRERRLRVARQRHGAQEGVYHAEDGGYSLGRGQERHRHGRVRHEEPDERRHDGPRLVPRIHPYTLVLPRAEGQ